MSTSRTDGRMPLGILILTLGIFSLGTSEFMMAGILEMFAGELGISIPDAGLSITVFAIGMFVSAPIVSALTITLPPKSTLLTAMSVFTAAHFATALTEDYRVILALRLVSAIACAAFWAIGTVVAVRMVPAAYSGRAIATLVGGITLANVLGIPLGSFVGHLWGWQAVFVTVGVFSAIGLVLTALFVDGEHTPSTEPLGRILRREIVIFKRLPLLVALGTTVLFQSAVFTTLSYITPMLTQVAGLPEHLVSLAMLMFGVGTLIGVMIGGRYAHVNMLGNIFLSLTGMLVSLALMWLFSGWAPGFLGAFVLFGIASFSIAGALNGRVFQIASDSQVLVAGFNVAAFNVGNTIGPTVGALLISAGMGYLSPLAGSAALGLGAVGFATWAWVLQRRSKQAELHETSQEQLSRV
ncbi:MFS transporter [Zhihengliuella halotolerans]|uniref:MFS transporter n=1 Tax=Zhihengliuella halotolerans TaxID=370736 RepID=UPI000C806FF7|nr:MFS transporter [Zhihengliuella halotolerans]